MILFIVKDWLACFCRNYLGFEYLFSIIPQLERILNVDIFESFRNISLYYLYSEIERMTNKVLWFDILFVLIEL